MRNVKIFNFAVICRDSRTLFSLVSSVNGGSTARQADQGIKHERFKVKCSLVSLNSTGIVTIRVDELRKHEQDSNVKGKG